MKSKLVLLGAVVTTGLVAGLFYAFAVSVNPAFVELSDQAYIFAMQAINRAIQNSFFFVSFFGALILLLWAVWLHRGNRRSAQFRLLVIAALLYVTGFGITVAGNVPLNNKLHMFDLQTATPLQATTMRHDYANSWNAWHTARTVVTIGAFVCVAAASIWTPPSKQRKKEE